MKPESLDRRISLERYVSSTDAGTGEEVKTWGALGPGTISASRRRASANETLASAELAATISDVFVIRYGSEWADVNPKDRLVFEGRTYEIVSVDEIDRRDGIRISAIARAE